jgi:AraC-like DNA-binding protein
MIIEERKHKVRLYYRPTKLPTVPLPMGLRSVGHNMAGLDWQDYPQTKSFIQLFWSVNGSGKFLIDGETHLLPENHVVLYWIGDKHLIWAASRVWEYRFITLDGPKASSLIKTFDFPRTPVFSGPCPLDLFYALERQVKDVTPSGQYKAAATAFSILSKARVHDPSNSSKDRLIESCKRIIEQEFSQPDLNVNRIAERLSIHRSRLSRLFRETYNMSLVDYLISMRIQKGLSLLNETDLTVKEIAHLTGYDTADYFAKSVKKATGQSPKAFRMQM